LPDVFNLAVPTVGKRESKLPFYIVKKTNPNFFWDVLLEMQIFGLIILNNIP